MYKSFVLPVVLLWCLLPSTVSAQDVAGLKPGDAVEIAVWQRPGLSGMFTVAPNGALLHPLYRQVQVAGIPVDEVEPRIRDFLAQFETDPQVVVQPFYKVAVSGVVMTPALYNVPPGTTVSEAVLRAGGVIEQDRADDVLLVRTGTTMEVDLTDPADATARQPVRSGDQILVEPGETTRSVLQESVLPIFQLITGIASVVAIATN
ncbi:MAG: polysaccharide biosynthesis/export family protein [Gemmatimonadota bacterium]|nr:polysaccharide biosynthesis/export family protein [Gemmatimonadota bacterium]